MSTRTPKILAYLLASVLVLSVLSRTEPAEAAWRVTRSHQIGRVVRDVAVDGKGNVFVVGSRRRGGMDRMLFARFGPGGKRQWSRTWLPEGPADFGGEARTTGEVVAVAPRGAVYVAGTVATACEGGSWFLRRYTPKGRLVWHRELPGWRRCRTAEAISDLAVAGDRLLVTGGRYGCCSAAADESWVRAYTTSGRKLWTTDFEVPSVRDELLDWAAGVAADPRGRVYVTGRVEMAPRTDVVERVDHEAVVQQLSPAGRVRWTWTTRDAGVKDRDEGVDVVALGHRVIVLSQMNQKRTSAGNGWLARFTPKGSIVWRRTWGPKEMRFPAGLAMAPSGRIFVVGDVVDESSEYDVAVHARNRAGRAMWSLSFDEGQRSASSSGAAYRSTRLYVGGSTWRKSVGWLWRLEA